MSSFLEKLVLFVNTDRGRFETRDSNVFASAFSKIKRYYEFLRIILKRHDEASKALLSNTNQLQSISKKGTHSLTEEQSQLYQEAARIVTDVHLEIESFYLFAKILLDNVARAVEYYFGPARGLALDSHDDLAKRLDEYAKGKCLSDIPEKLRAVINVIKTEISDYRDYEIAHENSPRSMKATLFSTVDQSATRVVRLRLFPTERDVQTESKSLLDLIAKLDEYLNEMLVWLNANKTHTALTLAEGREPVTDADRMSE